MHIYNSNKYVISIFNLIMIEAFNMHIPLT